MKNQFSPQLWDKIWEWPGDKASWWLEPSLFVPDFVLQGWVLSAFWTVYKQTVCTRLPCSLQTQEPGIKANIYAVIYIMHADTVKKNSITWVVEIQPNSYINIHTTPIQHFWQGDGKCLYKILSDSHSSIVWQRRFYKLQKTLELHICKHTRVLLMEMKRLPMSSIKLLWSYMPLQHRPCCPRRRVGTVSVSMYTHDGPE